MRSFKARAALAALALPLLFCGGAGELLAAEDGIVDVTVHHAASAADLELVNALPEGAVAVLAAARDIPHLANAYRVARSSGAKPVLPGACTVIVVGPLLDTPDRVQVGRQRHDGERIEVTLDFTNVRALGEQLRRNVPWRPLVELRLTLTPGAYRLRAIWRPVRALPNGEPTGPERVTEVSFRIA